MMKVSDYIVQFMENRGISDIFGYPGVGCGHFMNSLSSSKITSHLTYHEQAAAFAACSYAQASHNVGIAYSTAGPGATNLLTGIANAYCDSIPTIFIVGDKDLASLRGNYNVRQLTSQEVNIVDMAKPVSKLSVMVKREEDIRYYLEQAWHIASEGRPGPVLLDIPSDVQRAEVNPSLLKAYDYPAKKDYQEYIDIVLNSLIQAEKPVCLIGNGIKQAGLEKYVLNICEYLNVPIVTTLVASDLLVGKDCLIGFIGMDGSQAANSVLQKCDLLISLGARLNFKQIAGKRENFAPRAKIIRIDSDKAELEVRIRDEVAIEADLRDFVPQLLTAIDKFERKDANWLKYCIETKKTQRLCYNNNEKASDFIRHFAKKVPDNISITVDVGSHRRWVMTQFRFKEHHRLYQSAGLASMGYSLPAAIGVYYATRLPVLCFNGDGGIMMNLQELQYIHREQIPITIIILNNSCLGDIMEFQKRIFEGNYFTTTEKSGYEVADFENISRAFGLKYTKLKQSDNLNELQIDLSKPQIIEVELPSNE